jgi:hypothetical protein
VTDRLAPALASPIAERKYRTVTSSSTFGYTRPEDGAYIAYRVDGDGPIDVVWQPDWPGHIDWEWQDPLFGSSSAGCPRLPA